MAVFPYPTETETTYVGDNMIILLFSLFTFSFAAEPPSLISLCSYYLTESPRPYGLSRTEMQLVAVSHFVPSELSDDKDEITTISMLAESLRKRGILTAKGNGTDRKLWDYRVASDNRSMGAFIRESERIKWPLGHPFYTWLINEIAFGTDLGDYGGMMMTHALRYLKRVHLVYEYPDGVIELSPEGEEFYKLLTFKPEWSGY